MNRDSFLTLLDDINVWSRGSERAPHKPLLLLLALASCQQGGSRRISFREIDPVLKQLLKDFGRPRASYHPEYPFFRLVRDELWELDDLEGLQMRESNTDPKRSELLDKDIHGGFPEAIHELLRSEPNLIIEAAERVIETHFPSSYRDDLMAAVGIDPELESVTRRKRDPRFRRDVIRVYEQRCAVCAFDVRVGDSTVGLEAAHIKWHQAGGPSVPSNGLALCALHHKLFDRGAFTVGNELRVEVSEHSAGGPSFGDWLLRFHGEPLARPVSPQYEPDREFVDWHREQVFRSPGRPS